MQRDLSGGRELAVANPHGDAQDAGIRLCVVADADLGLGFSGECMGPRHDAWVPDRRGSLRQRTRCAGFIRRWGSIGGWRRTGGTRG